MLYLTSDLHGNIDGFKTLLNVINFNHNDKVIILGDIIDRGKYGIELIQYIKPFVKSGSIELLLGNHEMFLLKYLRGTLDPSLWCSFGGTFTYQAVKKLSKIEKIALIDFLESLSLYKEIYSKYLGGNVICTHSGLHENYLIQNSYGKIDVKKSLDSAFKNAEYSLLCGTDLHHLDEKTLKNLDRYIIVGHLPTYRLHNNDNSFYRTPYYMDIDTGSGYVNGNIGCYVVDNDIEIYI